MGHPDGAPIDWDGSLDEIAVAVPEQFLDDVDVDGDRRRNVARCKLEIRHGFARRDQEIVLMTEEDD